MARTALVIIALAGYASAQYYPRLSRSNGAKSTAVIGANKEITATFHGTLKQLSGKELVIQNQEDQTVVIRRSRKTKFYQDNKEIKASDLDLNTLVAVDVTQDVDLKPVAVAVTVEALKKRVVPDRDSSK